MISSDSNIHLFVEYDIPILLHQNGYYDVEGQHHEEVFEDYFSELLQHEIDHLDGVLFTDHLRGLRKERARRALKRIQKDAEAEEAS